jgi:hypothetical protein
MASKYGKDAMSSTCQKQATIEILNLWEKSPGIRHIVKQQSSKFYSVFYSIFRSNFYSLSRVVFTA